MMLPEMRAIVTGTAPRASRAEISAAILDLNLLGKPTRASRKKSLAHLVQLYGLDPAKLLFCVLRFLASLDPRAVPILALVCAYCRDPQLRASFGLIRMLRMGEPLERSQMEAHLAAAFPGRFSAATIRSLAQNTSASWTACGHLRGRVNKARGHPEPRATTVTYALLAGYLAGFRGQRLLDSEFGALACPEPALIPSQLALAAAHGFVGFKRAGGVVEFDFSPVLKSTGCLAPDVAD